MKNIPNTSKGVPSTDPCWPSLQSTTHPPAQSSAPLRPGDWGFVHKKGTEKPPIDTASGGQCQCCPWPGAACPFPRPALRKDLGHCAKAMLLEEARCCDRSPASPLTGAARVVTPAENRAPQVSPTPQSKPGVT